MIRPSGRARRCAAAEGFTLLEVLAAVAVLSFAFVVLLSTEGLNLRRAAHASRLLEASQLARERMERVLDSGSDASTDEPPASGSFTLSSSVSDTEYAGLSQVQVTVSWKEGERVEEFSVAAFLAR